MAHKIGPRPRKTSEQNVSELAANGELFKESITVMEIDALFNGLRNLYNKAYYSHDQETISTSNEKAALIEAEIKSRLR